MSLLTLLATIFTLYFFWQKIGNKVSVTYKIVRGGLSEKRISNITLINRKNKPVTVFSIIAIINDDILVEVEKFEPAITLNSLTSKYIETTPFSYLNLDGRRYEGNSLYMRPNKVDLYLRTEKNKIKCNKVNPPGLILENFNPYFGVYKKIKNSLTLETLKNKIQRLKQFKSIENIKQYFIHKDYRQATKETKAFNGKVYRDREKYAITYGYDFKVYTAFIDHPSGVIKGDWDF
ncbi:MAG: hypothetical protein GY739_12250, partial [Mesoflavibacter sp.]|nr:hypothetical protein [Mesoflavibacter sp.]